MSQFAKITARDFFTKLHDIDCNQKYNKTLPYSFHLDCVADQAEMFNHLLQPGLGSIDFWPSVYGHDSIEDARMTYNDLLTWFGELTAEAIYLCTENKGRNRLARKGKEWYEDLKTNKLAVFVKLCDIIANVKFSILTNSSMLSKYRSEYPTLVEYVLLSHKDLTPMFLYLEQLLKINES